MKLKMNYAENKDGKHVLVNVDFVAENEEEKSNLDWLRDYFFFGDSDKGTFPEYGGRRSDDKGTTEMIRLDIPKNAIRLLADEELKKVDGMDYPSKEYYNQERLLRKYKSTDE
jgi:hypothetical protein